MEMTPEKVRAMAGQARLALTDEEAERIAENLSQVLAAAEELQNLDLADVEPTVHILPHVNVMRDDVVQPSLPREAALAAAPDAEDGFVKVPRVMEE